MTGTERKTINKYYPPDFDPRKLPRGRFEPNRQFVQRVMAPFNMRCNTCHEYIYKGKKFNARRETVQDDDYLGLSLFRFYMRCPGCLAEITFKTDLKNCDYSEEHGATRLFEAERLHREEQEKTLQQEEEDKTNPMKMLENRTKMSRFEMDALERLEELREMNLRQSKPDYEKLLDGVTHDRQLTLQKQVEEDEKFVSALFGKTADGKTIKRIKDDVDGGILTEPVCSTSNSKEKIEVGSKVKKKVKLTDQRVLLAGVVKRVSQVELPSTTLNFKDSTSQKAASPKSAKTRDATFTCSAKKSSLNLVSNYSSSDSD